ncbi:MAG TPA: hypothetical protein VH934_15450 [Xanthobacteraceae bacterium]
MTAFSASVIVHAAAMRLAGCAGAVAVFVGVGGVIGVALIGYCLVSYGWTPATLAASLTYAFFCELYIFLFTLVGNSVSIGLLTKLASQPLKPAAIVDFYRKEAMIARRFEQLGRGNLLSAGPAGLELTVRGARIVRIFSLVHALLHRPNRWVSRMSCEGDDAS